MGRSEYDSPEVDNEVLLDASHELVVGAFVDALITDATEYDLHAVPVAAGVAAAMPGEELSLVGRLQRRVLQ